MALLAGLLEISSFITSPSCYASLSSIRLSHCPLPPDYIRHSLLVRNVRPRFNMEIFHVSFASQYQFSLIACSDFASFYHWYQCSSCFKFIRLLPSPPAISLRIGVTFKNILVAVGRTRRTHIFCTNPGHLLTSHEIIFAERSEVHLHTWTPFLERKSWTFRLVWFYLRPSSPKVH